MATRRQRKLEKKRRKEKQRQIKHRNRPVSAASLAYHGDRYKTAELVPLLADTETGILEAFAVSDRRLTDGSVEQALVKMIMGMRRDTLLPLEGKSPSQGPTECHPDDEEGLVIWRICDHWRSMFEDKPAPARDTFVGILRTILGSIEVWRSPGPTSRGYLRYMEGFLGRVGISVERLPLGEEPEEEVGLDPFEELLEVGREWCHDRNEEARLVFENLAQHLIHSGEPDTVVGVCQQLIGESGKSPAITWLMDFSLAAQRAMQGAR